MPLRPVRHAVAAALLASTFAAWAQDGLPPGVRGGPQATATRSVSQYLDLERALAASLHARRRDAIERMLAPGFELRSAESIDAAAAADWLSSQMRPGAPEAR